MEFKNIKPMNKVKYNFSKQGLGIANFEHDSCPQTWKHYEIVYQTTIAENKGWDKSLNIEMDVYSQKILSLYRDGRNGIYRNIQYIEINDKKYKFGGECDFNFSEKKLRKKISRYEGFRVMLNEIEDKAERNKYLSRLNECRDKHHKLSNMSLMLVTGGMQLAKGRGSSLSSDRFDVWIYKLNEFFEKRKLLKVEAEELMKLKEFHNICGNNGSKSNQFNRRNLLDFLNMFTDIHHYMELIYFITSRELIDKIIKNGQKPINCYIELCAYVDLALEYWKVKEDKFQNIYACRSTEIG